MVGYADFTNGTKLHSLKLGDASADYSNTNLIELHLGNNTLLKTLDVRNCPNLGTGANEEGTVQSDVDISGCTNIEHVYFDGTSIKALTLPNGGGIKTLHLPGTITNLTLRNQTALTEFVLPSYSNITTLRLENNSSIIDPLAILAQMPANSRVRIVGFEKTVASVEEIHAFYDGLDTMRGLDENGNNVDKAQVSGKIYIDSLTSEDLYYIKSRYPSINVVYNTITLYSVRFYNGSTLLQTVENLNYLDRATYTGETPQMQGVTNPEDFIFLGWNPEPVAKGNVDCYAVYQFTGSYTRALVDGTISGELVNDRVTAIEDNAFNGCAYLTAVSFPAATIIDVGAFQNCSALTETNFPVVTTIGTSAFHSCKKLTKLDLPMASSIAGSTFYGCITLKALILRKADGVCAVGNNAFAGTPIAEGDGYIYVPSALVDSYKNSSGWSTLASKIRAIEDYPEICGGEN
jgi:hypothetical protein